MKWKEWLEKWSMSSLKINTVILNMEFKPNDVDKNAAWSMYIELLTRITTQPLSNQYGDEKTALESVYSMFQTTRNILKEHGRFCEEFTKISIIILNQKIRPFTQKWHKVSLNDGFNDLTNCNNFRKELEELQQVLKIYTKMLSEMANVEDLTELENI